MSTWEDVEARKEQARIEANKVFIQCLNKMAKIAYKKLDVKPHPDEPLKRTIGVYKTPLYNIRIDCTLREIYKRYNYNKPQDTYDRYQFEPSVYIGLEIQKHDGKGLVRTNYNHSRKLGHITNRSPKLFLKRIEEMINGIDCAIKQEDDAVNEQIEARNKKQEAFNQIAGLTWIDKENFVGSIGDHTVGASTYREVCVFDSGDIKLTATITPKQLNAITKYLGWRK